MLLRTYSDSYALKIQSHGLQYCFRDFLCHLMIRFRITLLDLVNLFFSRNVRVFLITMQSLYTLYVFSDQLNRRHWNSLVNMQCRHLEPTRIKAARTKRRRCLLIEVRMLSFSFCLLISQTSYYALFSFVCSG